MRIIWKLNLILGFQPIYHGESQKFDPFSFSMVGWRHQWNYLTFKVNIFYLKYKNEKPVQEISNDQILNEQFIIRKICTVNGLSFSQNLWYYRVELWRQENVSLISQRALNGTWYRQLQGTSWDWWSTNLGSLFRVLLWF